MSEANEAWQVAWQRFTDGYGNEPDLHDGKTDRPLFLQTLEEVIREGIETKLAQKFAEGAERMRGIGAAQ